MNGWQRFMFLLMCYFVVMVLYPNYDAAGLYFVGITLAMWTGAILVLSIISNMFGLYNFPSLNKLITFILIVMIMCSLLWYFPQKDNVTPINKIKYGEIPTKADIEHGLNRFTLNFDFVHRRANRAENFVNQEIEDNKKGVKETKEKLQKNTQKAVKKVEDTLDIKVD